MTEQFRTPWLSDVVDLIKRDSTNRIMVGNKEFVLVVRCKDCENWVENEHCLAWEYNYSDADGYCYLGKRRDLTGTQMSLSENLSERKEDDYKESEINPCRGCEDYDGEGGCLSHGGCGERREDAETN